MVDEDEDEATDVTEDDSCGNTPSAGPSARPGARIEERGAAMSALEETKTCLLFGRFLEGSNEVSH